MKPLLEAFFLSVEAPIADGFVDYAATLKSLATDGVIRPPYPKPGSSGTPQFKEIGGDLGVLTRMALVASYVQARVLAILPRGSAIEASSAPENVSEAARIFGCTRTGGE